ncbi:MAG: hypothetical protein P1V97_19035 [Planctomycetota bacterium]|nr:hypothetical protein [Planctomycetota bacterium]
MAREGGASIFLYVALILSIIFLIGAVGAVIVMDSELEKLKKDITLAKKDTLEQKEKVKQKLAVIEKMEQVITGGESKVDYNNLQKTLFKDARSRRRVGHRRRHQLYHRSKRERCLDLSS